MKNTVYIISKIVIAFVCLGAAGIGGYCVGKMFNNWILIILLDIIWGVFCGTVWEFLNYIIDETI